MPASHPSQPLEGSERIRAAVANHPRKMTLQLARDLGVPEVEIIRAFPADRVMALDISRWEELLRELEVLGSLRVSRSEERRVGKEVGTEGGTEEWKHTTIK